MAQGDTVIIPGPGGYPQKLVDQGDGTFARVVLRTVINR